MTHATASGAGEQQPGHGQRDLARRRHAAAASRSWRPGATAPGPVTSAAAPPRRSRRERRARARRRSAAARSPPRRRRRRAGPRSWSGAPGRSGRTPAPARTRRRDRRRSRSRGRSSAGSRPAERRGRSRPSRSSAPRRAARSAALTWPTSAPGVSAIAISDGADGSACSQRRRGHVGDVTVVVQRADDAGDPQAQLVAGAELDRERLAGTEPERLRQPLADLDLARRRGAGGR